MVALVVFGVLTSGTFAFLLAQNRGFRSIATKSSQIQNGRFGRDVMRQELRTAGTNVADLQPMLVFANDSTLAFNTDLTTNKLDSARFTGAVYVDPYASDMESTALSMANAITIPGSSPGFAYPLADYSAIAGTSADAELLIFRFSPDTATSGNGDYVLTRQVNGAPPEVLANGLKRSLTVPFFRYWYDPTRYSSTLTDLDTVPSGWLPLEKTAALRGVGADTGTAASARIDHVRGVEVTYETTLPVGGKREVVRYVVPMPNTALAKPTRACGRPPIASSAPVAVWRADSNAVLITWGPAADDGAGEYDAVRYLLLRRLSGASACGEPLVTLGVVPGTASYVYKDTGVQTGLGRLYQYALAVQDCTPNVSGLSVGGVVVVP